jgi:rubrerythrin
MELEPRSSAAVSRRRLFHAAGAATAAGSAALLAACGGGSGPKESKGSKQADIALLNSAIDLENTAIAAYTAGAPLLKGPALKSGRELLGQEKDHADALSTAVSQLGGHPLPPKASYQFPGLRDQRAVLRLLDTIEHELIGVYLDALPKLGTPKLRAQVASILTTEAEHLAVVLGLAGRPQAPRALVSGRA